MRHTNFHLSLPVKPVDGLVAVPIDIQHITAKLTFDGAVESGNGDAPLEFIMGPQNGNPIFADGGTMQRGIWTTKMTGRRISKGNIRNT